MALDLVQQVPVPNDGDEVSFADLPFVFREAIRQKPLLLFVAIVKLFNQEPSYLGAKVTADFLVQSIDEFNRANASFTNIRRHDYKTMLDALSTIGSSDHLLDHARVERSLLQVENGDRSLLRKPHIESNGKF